METKEKSNGITTETFTHRKSVVQGLMYDGSNEREVKRFLKRVPHNAFLQSRKKNPIVVFSKLGAMEMEIGDYVVQTETGEQYVIDKSEFGTYYTKEESPEVEVVIEQPVKVVEKVIEKIVEIEKPVKIDDHLPWKMLKQRYINKCNRLEKDSLEYKIAKHMLDEIRELERTYK